MQSIDLGEILWNFQNEDNGVTRLNDLVSARLLHNKSETNVLDGQIGLAAHDKQQKTCSKTPMRMLIDTAYLYT